MLLLLPLLSASPRCSRNDPLKYKVEHASHAQKSLVISHLTQPQFPHPQHYGSVTTLYLWVFILFVYCTHRLLACYTNLCIYYIYWLLSGSLGHNFKLQDGRDLYVVSLT